MNTWVIPILRNSHCQYYNWVLPVVWEGPPSRSYRAFDKGPSLIPKEANMAVKKKEIELKVMYVIPVLQLSGGLPGHLG